MQRVAGAPKDYLLVTFGLDYEKKSSRIAVSTEAVPNRWTHHVIVTEQKEIDDELLGWIEESYIFSSQKAGGNCNNESENPDKFLFVYR